MFKRGALPVILLLIGIAVVSAGIFATVFAPLVFDFSESNETICEFENAYWSANEQTIVSARVGENVTLVVEGVNCSANESVEFFVSGGETQPSPSKFIDGKAESSWVVEDLKGDESSGNKYSFVATLDSGVSVDGPILLVLELGEKECNNGIDDDGDGWVDYLWDPGCEDSDDDTESNLVTNYECSDGKDNDGDGFIDGADADCFNWFDGSEAPDKKDEDLAECSDGKDNDGDGLIDYLDDPGCVEGEDDSEEDEVPSACSDGVDNDGDGFVDFGDWKLGFDPGCDSSSDEDERGDWADSSYTKPVPKGLINFRNVGFSLADCDTSGTIDNGCIGGNVWDESEGWQKHIDNDLEVLFNDYGFVQGDFDDWLHNPGGIWGEMDYATEGDSSKMWFEQMELGRNNLPGLTDFSVLKNYASGKNMDLYGYIGFPRCDDGFLYTPVLEHCQAGELKRWYEEFVDYGFVGVVHDWAQNLPQDSKALEVNFPFLRDLGIEPLIEAVPEKGEDYLLGYDVVAQERRWIFTEARLDDFYSEDEINSAGGRTFHIVNHLPEGVSDPIQKWRWETSVDLLKQGKVVVVNLRQLAEAGHDISCLVELSKDKNSDCAD